RKLMAVVVALKELISRRAETVPYRFGLVAANRTDRLPLGLQPFHFGDGRVPFSRRRERFGPLTERFLLREVVGPQLLSRHQVVTAASEEEICGNAEAMR